MLGPTGKRRKWLPNHPCQRLSRGMDTQTDPWNLSLSPFGARSPAVVTEEEEHTGNFLMRVGLNMRHTFLVPAYGSCRCDGELGIGWLALGGHRGTRNMFLGGPWWPKHHLMAEIGHRGTRIWGFFFSYHRSGGATHGVCCMIVDFNGYPC